MTGSYRAYAKLYIAHTAGTVSFGQGLVDLLRGVDEKHSLNRAAKDMHMAYSKAWTLMNRAEENLGTKLIVRNGARGSTLTDEARRLLAAYEAVQKDLQDYANTRLQEALSEQK